MLIKGHQKPTTTKPTKEVREVFYLSTLFGCNHPTIFCVYSIARFGFMKRASGSCLFFAQQNTKPKPYLIEGLLSSNQQHFLQRSKHLNSELGTLLLNMLPSSLACYPEKNMCSSWSQWNLQQQQHLELFILFLVCYSRFFRFDSFCKMFFRIPMPICCTSIITRFRLFHSSHSGGFQIKVGTVNMFKIFNCLNKCFN